MALGPFRTPPRIRAPTRSSCCRADTTDARVALFGPITRSTFFVTAATTGASVTGRTGGASISTMSETRSRSSRTFAHGRRSQELRRILGHGAARNEPQRDGRQIHRGGRGKGYLLNDGIQGQSAGQDVTEPDQPVAAEELVEARSPQVRGDERHALAGPRQDDPEVRDRRGLALPAVRAGHDDALGARRGGPEDVGPKDPIRLRGGRPPARGTDQVGALAAAPVGDPGNHPEDGSFEILLDLVRGPQPSGHPVTDER